MSERLEGLEVLDLLRARGHLANDQYQLAISEAQQKGMRLEEAVIQTKGMDEAELMKWLAGHYKTQFVSTEKLARANVDRQLIRLVPRQLAQRLGVCPILWKAPTATLAVVAAAPSLDIEEQIRVASGARSVKVLVARPAAVRAAIAKHYDGDARAFVPLVGERAKKRKKSNDLGVFDTGAFRASDATSIPLDGFDSLDDFGFGGPAPNPPAPARPSAPQPPPAPPPEASPLVISAPDIMAGLAAASPPSADSTPRHSSMPPGDVAQEREAYLDMLHVMVTLLERDRKELKDHSLEVARITRELCDRLGLRGEARHAIVIAAYVHDIGKSGSYHLTSLNVSRYEGHRAQAQKSYATPARLFGGASVPQGTLDTLNALYERWDGTGFPNRLGGKDIPLGARIVAIAETFADLTGHAKNPYRRALQPAEAVNAIQGFAESVFDPSLCRLLKELAIGDLEKKLLADRRTVLLIDPDPDETTVLDIRLSTAGFEVRVARDAADAIAMVRDGDIDAIVSEVELPGGASGFDLLRKLEASGQQRPILFLTSRGDRESVNEGFSLGAADYLVKPASPEVVAAKVQQIFSASAGQGIRGSLSEMALPDVVQVLGNGRKSGRLLVRGGGVSGDLHFREGSVWDARTGELRGEDAFHALMRVQEGEFQLDPTQIPTARLIEAPIETLLLEAMRRIDES